MSDFLSANSVQTEIEIGVHVDGLTHFTITILKGKEYEVSSGLYLSALQHIYTNKTPEVFSCVN